MIIPPIKIQGKKTKLIPKIMEIAQAQLDEHPEITTWVEPFLGSGVVAFNGACLGQIKKVVVNDINPHIIQFYDCINSGTLSGDMVRETLGKYGQELSRKGEKYYNEIRDRFNNDYNVMDFLFLTRTGFNGVMRFNSKGRWNVPFCKLNDRLNKDVVEDLAHSVDELSNLFSKKEFEFHNESFENLMDISDAIYYCDPPYYGLNVQYYKGWEEEQEILLNKKLSDKVFIYSTWINDGHKDNPMIKKHWDKYIVDRQNHKYNVANKASDRKGIVEGIIYPSLGNGLW